MKNTNTKKLFAIGMIVASIATAGFYGNVSANNANSSNQDTVLELVDFSIDKKEILTDLYSEINDLKDTTFQTTVEKEAKSLENINNEDAFFDKLEAVYTTLDDYYEKNNIQLEWMEDDNLVEELDNIESEDWETFEMNFSELKEEILTGLQSEIKVLQDVNLKSKVEKEAGSLKNISDEDVFFEKLETIYKTLDDYYEENNISTQF